MEPPTGPVGRIVTDAGQPDLVDVLAALPGADLTSLLLEVMRRRAAGLSPADVLRRYQQDRFAAPGAVDATLLRRTEQLAVDALPADTELITLAPVAPLGTHSVLATVDQNKVVSTARGSEVAADPTNVLALEAAVRRRALLGDDPRSPRRVRLAALQRVTRAQRFDAAGAFAHFQLLGLVTAGRDTGDRAFERETAGDHIAAAVGACSAAGADAVGVEVTDFSGGELRDVVAAVRERLAAVQDAAVVDRPDRPHGAGYYDRFCFKVFARFGAHRLEIGDGGLVGWTRELVASRKERCMISGLGLDRLAAPHAAA
jgi:hypothetical protein